MEGSTEMWMLKTVGGGLTYQGPQGNELHNLQSLKSHFLQSFEKN